MQPSDTVQLDHEQAAYIAIAQKISAYIPKQYDTMWLLPQVIGFALQDHGIKATDEVLSVAFYLVSPEEVAGFQELNPNSASGVAKTKSLLSEDEQLMATRLRPILAEGFKALAKYAGKTFTDEGILEVIRAEFKELIAAQVDATKQAGFPADDPFWAGKGFQHILDMNAERVADDSNVQPKYLLGDELLETFDPPPP